MILEDDVVLGTFTNEPKYLPPLIESVYKLFPNITFIVHIDDKPINVNFEALRQKFMKTGKRFWVFLDHDIKFLFEDTIKIAVETLVKGRFGLVGVYSTFDPNFTYKLNPEEPPVEVEWTPGYFQMVDSRLFGDVAGDLDLPDPNTAIDTSYCCAIKARGGKIGLAPTYVYHLWKPIKGFPERQDVIDKTNMYLYNKWGRYYADTIGKVDCVLEYCDNKQFVNCSNNEMQENKKQLLSYQKEELNKEEKDKNNG